LNYLDLVNDKAEANTFGSGKHGFTEGGDGTVPRSLIRDTFLNGVLGEIMNVIESIGMTGSGVDRAQLSKAIAIRSLAHALGNIRRIQPAGGSDNFRSLATHRFAALAVGNDGSGNRRMVSSLNNGTTWTTAGGTVGGDLDRCACSKTIGVAVGAGGDWSTITLGSSATPTSGTFSGSPAMGQPIYDDVNGLFWIPAATGLFKSTDGTTWTQVGATTDFTKVCALPSGRVVAYRSADDRLYYADSPHTATTQGPVVGITAEGGTDFDMKSFASGLAMIGSDSGGNYDFYFSADGTAVTQRLNFSSTLANNRIISCGGLIGTVISDGTNHKIALLLTPDNFTDFVEIDIPYDLTVRALGSSFGSFGAPSAVANEFVYLTGYAPQVY
jgi:hypothetical protein